MTDNLRDFTDIHIYDDSEEERVVEAAAFLSKMDSEGGLTDFLDWGGVDAFPEGLRPAAAAFNVAYEQLQGEVKEWHEARGVRY